MKYVIVIEDGASDYPIEEIDGKTPLKIANKPVLDKIAREGKTGLIQNVPETLPPGSDVANMSIFGYDPLEYYTGRGPLEAASMGVETKEGDVVFRCNTITLLYMFCTIQRELRFVRRCWNLCSSPFEEMS